MKPKKLLMVTSYYPYGHGESFIKAELEHIAGYFEELQIVPCFHAPATPGQPPRPGVNLDYAAVRWGLLRGVHVLTSLAAALRTYRWRDDALRILRRPHRMENFKELARALYRAKLFERFLARHIVKDKHDVSMVYFYWMIPEIVGAVAFRRHSGYPLKVVCRAHRGDLYEDLRAGGYAGLRDAIVTGIDDVYCISDHGRAYLAERYPFLAKKFHTARLGVNDPGCLNGQPREQRLSIVSCSFVVYEKRVHLIVDAIAHLLEQDPALTIKWTHVGDGKLYEQLRAYVLAKLGSRVDVVFTGYLTQQQVMNLYRDTGFDVFVNVSDSEGIPVSLMEASSAGIPMVATDVGGSGEIVNAANGVLLPANPTVAQIAAALLLFGDRERAMVYRKRARLSWHEKYSAPVNYARFGQDLVQTIKPHANAA